MAVPTQILVTTHSIHPLRRMFGSHIDSLLPKAASDCHSSTSDHRFDYRQSLPNSRRHDLGHGLLSSSTRHSSIEQLLHMVDVGRVQLQWSPSVVDGLGLDRTASPHFPSVDDEYTTKAFHLSYLSDADRLSVSLSLLLFGSGLQLLSEPMGL